MLPPPPRSTLFPYTTLFRSKTYDFLGDSPHWNPAFDLQPNLAIGALAIDPARPDTLYAGTGDFVDGSGDTIQTTHDEIGRAHVELQSPVHLVCRLLLEKKKK